MHFSSVIGAPRPLCTGIIPRIGVGVHQCVRNVRPHHTSTWDSSRAKASSNKDVFEGKKFKDFAPLSREAVLQALKVLGNSATAAEVASKAALPVKEAEQCLQALAIEGSGSLKVCFANL